MRIHFSNTYITLPENFYQAILPTPVKAPKLIQFNAALADDVGVNYKNISKKELAEVFSGNKILEGSEPIALAYAGHQFGSFVPRLGDGRAILLGEVLDKEGHRRDIQLKGTGITAFSRSGDGRAALGPVMREYIVSEAMHALGIKTTRSLAMVTTGEMVFRERPLPGAILTRVAASHIRVGTFEYFARRGDLNSLKILADYAIQRHYPDALTEPDPYFSFLKQVAEAQASLIVEWMRVGFIHGVMNTDNMVISGETIDYGPCAFMDAYDPNTVFSSIDYRGRYAFANQANIALWNLIMLAQALSPLINRELEALVEEIVAYFKEKYEPYYWEIMSKKIGFSQGSELVPELLTIFQTDHIDYTLGFRYLTYLIQNKNLPDAANFSVTGSVEAWIKKWRLDLQEKGIPSELVYQTMIQVNPLYIPRNHQIEAAIQAGIQNADFSKMEILLKVLSKPYEDQGEAYIEYMLPPKPGEEIEQTFCGT